LNKKIESLQARMPLEEKDKQQHSKKVDVANKSSVTNDHTEENNLEADGDDHLRSDIGKLKEKQQQQQQHSNGVMALSLNDLNDSSTEETNDDSEQKHNVRARLHGIVLISRVNLKCLSNAINILI